MRTLIGCLLVLATSLFTTPTRAEDSAAPAATRQEAPNWAPGALATPQTLAVPGRIIARALGLSLVLPESWRADDVSTRELSGEEAKTVYAGAEAALIIEIPGKRDTKVPLLTVYRTPLKAWRALEKDGKAGPGRVTLTSTDFAFVVVRPADAKGHDRFATLRRDVEDVISTLAIYDARREGEALRAPIAADWAGKLPDGAPISMHLDPIGTLTITWGKDGKEGRGQWLQRESQVIAHVVGIDPRPKTPILMHFDGQALVVVTWDESVFGAAGARLEVKQ